MTNLGYTPEEAIAAIATPLSPGAIGIVRTSGKGCIQLVAKIFSRPNALLASSLLFSLIHITNINSGQIAATLIQLLYSFSIGMILFFLSDIFLTQMYFGGKPDDKTLCIVNHALYYAAQICVASFVFYM